MKRKYAKLCCSVMMWILTIFALTFPSAAGPARGKITKVGANAISGWAWNPEDTNDVQQVELHIFQSGKSDPVKYLHVEADDYWEDLAEELKDGWHGFTVKVDWSEFEGKDFKIRAYTVKGDQYYNLGEPVSYSRDSKKSSKTAPKTESSKTKPAKEESPKAESPKAESSKGEASSGGRSLGIFSVSGYCNCQSCGGGSGITYSGAVPQANHTIAADLTILPLGSKVRIGDTVYTVEDKGSAIQGKKIDIYYDSHDQAVSHGLTSQEVFLLQ